MKRNSDSYFFYKVKHSFLSLLWVILLFYFLAFTSSCTNNTEQPAKSNFYIEPDSTTKIKFLGIEKDYPSDSTIVNALLQEKGWIGVEKFEEDEIKKNHFLILQVTTDASRWTNPILIFSGRFSNIAIYDKTKLLYSSKEDVIDGNYLITKVFPVNRDSILKISICIYYHSFYDLPALTFFRIGESSKLTEGNLVFPGNFSVFSALNLGFIFETIGLICFFASLFYSGRNRRMLFYFSIFLFISGITTLQELLQYYINVRPYYFNLSCFILASFIPLSFIGFIKNALLINHRKLLSSAFIANLLWCVALPVLSLLYPITFVYWIGMVTVVFLILIVLAKEKVYKNPEFRYPLWGLFILILILLISALSDFKILSFSINVDFGILAFVIGLAIYTIKNIIRSKREILMVNMELQQSQNRLLILENENIQSQFEALKGQLNPHFLFNSLNTLASLINIDKIRATRYVEEFSALYRRLLDSKNEMLVPLKEELHFLNSYIYLQKIRFGDNLQFVFEVNDNDLDKLVPPLSLQLLIENAFKHNEVSEDFPLKIVIKSSGEYLEIANPLQPKIDMITRKGIGIENLSKRYLQISDRDLIIEKTDTEFIIKIPLIDEF